jgi:hypothetical protein
MARSRDSASNETKGHRFERLAERRVTGALRSLRLVANLANRHNYEYTQDHARQILEALDEGLRHIKQRFRQEEAGVEDTFSFRK